MDNNQYFSRSELLLGSDAMQRMAQARVALFGVGGVGSWAAEALVRTGVKHLSIIDFDDIAQSNVNRQLPALRSTIGQSKVEVMRLRLLDINPDAEILSYNQAYSPGTAEMFDFEQFDYVIDAIDSLRDKALLIRRATAVRSCKLFSSMGAALRTDPTRVSVAEFWDVKGDRLAAALRQRFRREGEYPARKFKVVYSSEPIRENCFPAAANGSLMPVTATFGMTLASLVINDIACIKRKV